MKFQKFGGKKQNNQKIVIFFVVVVNLGYFSNDGSFLDSKVL